MKVKAPPPVEVITLIATYADRVCEATKSQGASVGKNKSERAAARRLLAAVLGRVPTEEEVESVIPA